MQHEPIFCFTPNRQAWVHHFKFDEESGTAPHTTYSANDFAPISPSTNAGGQHSPGVGWIHTTDTVTNGNNIRIYRDWGEAFEATIVSATAIYDMVEGTGAEEPGPGQVTIRLHSGTIDPGNINDTVAALHSKDSTTANDQELSIDEADFGAPTLTANGIDLRIWASDGGAEGSIVLKLLTIHGLGFNPFDPGAPQGGASRFSGEYGANFGEEKAVTASADGTVAHEAFDGVKRSVRALSTGDSQPRIVLSGSDDYDNYGAGLPFGAKPACMWIPRVRFGTDSGDNSATDTPEYLIASSDDAGGESLWKVTASGTVYTDITPSDGVDIGLAVSGDCLWMPWASGKIIAAILLFGSTRKLVVSEDAGVSWTVRRSLGADADYIRGSKSGVRSLLWTDGKPYYSPDLGITVYEKSYPGTAGGIAAYG